MKTEISVVIPTLNNINGLNYLLKYFKNKPHQVIVVDNGLDSRLRGNDKGKLVYLHKEKNLGFAGGVNKGGKG